MQLLDTILKRHGYNSLSIVSWTPLPWFGFLKHFDKCKKVDFLLKLPKFQKLIFRIFSLIKFCRENSSGLKMISEPNELPTALSRDVDGKFTNINRCYPNENENVSCFSNLSTPLMLSIEKNLGFEVLKK